MNSKIGSDDHERDDIESDRADAVFERLLRRVDGVDDVEDAKFRGFIEKQRERMENRDDQGDVAGPAVEAEIVEAVMRPVADWAVAEGHHDSEEHVDGDGGYGGEADVCGEIEDGDVHRKTARAVPSRKLSIIQ